MEKTPDAAPARGATNPYPDLAVASLSEAEALDDQRDELHAKAEKARRQSLAFSIMAVEIPWIHEVLGAFSSLSLDNDDERNQVGHAIACRLAEERIRREEDANDAPF